MSILGKFFVRSLDTSLVEAAETGDCEAVQQILKKSAKLDAATNDGVTPLILASQNGHADVVKLLLAAGANVHAANDKGATPLWMASQGGHTDVVILLLAARTDVNAARIDGGTPLWMASDKGHRDVVKLLLAASANVNAAASDGSTPLPIASREGHSNVVQLLEAKEVRRGVPDTDSRPNREEAARGRPEKIPRRADLVVRCKATLAAIAAAIAEFSQKDRRRIHSEVTGPTSDGLTAVKVVVLFQDTMEPPEIYESLKYRLKMHGATDFH